MVFSPILKVEGLSVSLKRGLVPLVSPLSFEIFKGKTLAIIGESGAGKTLTTHALIGLLSSSDFTVSGSAYFQETDLISASKQTRRNIVGTKITMIFQNPLSSFNPVLTIGQQFEEVIDTHLKLHPQHRLEIMVEALSDTGFHNPKRCLKLYPHELSGGMLQRASIAMALLTSPDIVIADEPTTALDVSIQYQILQLLRRLQQKTGMSLLIVTHNMGVVAEIADQVLVLYSGEAVEYGPVKVIFNTPAHSYTRELLNARPSRHNFSLASEKRKEESKPNPDLSYCRAVRY